MDWSVIVENWPKLWEATVVTVHLSAVILGLSTLLAILVAVGRLESNPLISIPLSVYSVALRTIPVLVVLYLAYYALPQVGIRLGSYAAATITVSIASSAYIGEIFRAGIVSVRPEQFEAAKALGMSFPHTMRRIIFPQAFRIILPPYISQAIVVVKGTSLAGIVAVSELTGTTYALMSKTYRPFELLAFAAAVYLGLTSILGMLQAYLEKKWKLRY